MVKMSHTYANRRSVFRSTYLHKPQHALQAHHQAGSIENESEMELELAGWSRKLLSSAFQEEVACIERLLGEEKLLCYVWTC